MDSVFIRDVESVDMPEIKSLVIQTWGEAWNLGRFADDNDKLFANLEIYLNILLNSSTFGRVAVRNNEVVGVIFCSMKDDEKRYRTLQEDSTHHTLIMLAATDDERFDTIEHLTKADGVMNELYESDISFGKYEFGIVGNEGITTPIVLSVSSSAENLLSASFATSPALLTSVS